MNRFLLLLLLSACASQPTTYERGALAPLPTRPAPRVGPTYDPRVVPLPPQPQPKPTRVLPQDDQTRREPGIWAATPRAGFDDFKDFEPLILGVRIPYVYEPPANSEETWPVRRCAAETSTIFDVYADHLALAALTSAERECLAGLAYEFCAGGERVIAWLKQGTLSPRARNLFERMVAKAVKFREERCAYDSTTQRVRDLLQLLPRHWTKVKS